MLSSFWKTTFLYGLGFIGLRMISFLLVPIYTQLLSPSDTGIIFIVYTILAFLNTLYSRGMDAALFKFYNKENSKTIISTSMVYSLKHGTILSVVLFSMYFLVDIVHQEQLTTVVIFGLVSVLFFDMISSRCMNILRLQNKPIYYLSACFTNIILSLGLNIYFIQYLNWGLSGALWSIILSAAVNIIIFFPIIFTSVSWKRLDKNLLNNMKTTSLPFLPAAIFLILIELADRWMLGFMSPLGTSDVGVYGAAYKFGSLIMLSVRGFNLNWQPYYLKPKHEKRFYKIGTLFLSLLIILSTLISILWPLLFKLLIGQLFWEGGHIIPLIAISYIFYGLFILQMPSIYLRNKENWAPVFWGTGFMVNILSNYYLIPLYGYYGAALSTLFAYLIMSLFILFKNLSWMRMSYHYGFLGIIILISLLAYTFIYNLNIVPGSTNVISACINISLAYTIITIPLVLTIEKKL
tara:strand:+ start:5172 stop:6563 length:1392 start_codon:yes stop_codon:yes gene_type:complete